jgi:hypothetical protein
MAARAALDLDAPCCARCCHEGLTAGRGPPYYGATLTSHSLLTTLGLPGEPEARTRSCPA